MNHWRHCLALAAALLGLAALPTWAASLAASSAAGGSSASSASSQSSDKSSDSSSQKNQVAEGTYKIIDIAALADRPGMVRLKLQALADPGDRAELLLDLPQVVIEQGQLATGQSVNARHRPYGTEFANADTHKAVFLLLDDDWVRELPSRPVVL